MNQDRIKQAQRRRWRLGLAAAVLLGAAAQAQAGGFERLSKLGEDVLKSCNPTNSPLSTKCRVTSLPGESGYVLVASRSAPILINEVVIGTQFERVWRKVSNPKIVILGVRLVMNAEQWDDSGKAFNVNDLIRQVRRNAGVEVAYFSSGSPTPKALQYAGRTNLGLNEYVEEQPERNNAWVDFRIDANAAELAGPSRAASPWLLLKTRAPVGVALQDFAIRLLNSENPERDQNSIPAAGYQPICLSEACEPLDDDEALN